MELLLYVLLASLLTLEWVLRLLGMGLLDYSIRLHFLIPGAYHSVDILQERVFFGVVSLRGRGGEIIHVDEADPNGKPKPIDGCRYIPCP